MTFTFQKNQDTFHHNEELLKKAEENIPTMYRSVLEPEGVCALCEDPIKLEGVGTQLLDTNLKDLKLKKGDQIILDFGTHCVGNFQIDIASTGSPMDAPLYMQIRFAEVAAELTHTSEEYNGWLSSSWLQEERIHLDVLDCTLRLPRRYAFRYVEITVLDTSPKYQVVFSNPKVTAYTSANQTSLPEFYCEDKLLQSIYDIGVKTLEDCMSDVFEDGPKRDRRLWLGDLRLQALANYKTFRNDQLVKRCLYLFAAMNTTEGKISANVFVHPKTIPDDTFLFDYSLFFISVLDDYLKEFRDPKLLNDLFPAAKAQMDLALTYVDDKGCWHGDPNYPLFVDWSDTFNKDTAGQAIVIYALKQFLHLCKLRGEKSLHYQQILEKMETYAREHLYNTKKHLFQTNGNEYNIASQAWMVLAGVMSEEENHQIMQAALASLFPITGIATPYMYHHITEALFVAEFREEALKLMKEYWGKMVELGADTFWEAFDPNNPNYSPYGSPLVSSYCHAWSCTPVYLLQKYLSIKTQTES